MIFNNTYSGAVSRGRAAQKTHSRRVSNDRGVDTAAKQTKRARQGERTIFVF